MVVRGYKALIDVAQRDCSELCANNLQGMCQAVRGSHDAYAARLSRSDLRTTVRTVLDSVSVRR
jgi:hypothetical protein